MMYMCVDDIHVLDMISMYDVYVCGKGSAVDKVDKADKVDKVGKVVMVVVK